MENPQQMLNEYLTSMQMQHAQELMSKMSDLCFDKCVQRPKYELDSTQRTCLSNCSETFMEGMHAASAAVNEHAEKQVKGV